MDLSTLSLEGMSSACTATVWLLSLGMAIIFSALASKTHRINKLTRSAKTFRRIKVSVKETLIPVVVVVTGTSLNKSTPTSLCIHIINLVLLLL